MSPSPPSRPTSTVPATTDDSSSVGPDPSLQEQAQTRLLHQAQEEKHTTLPFEVDDSEDAMRLLRCLFGLAAAQTASANVLMREAAVRSRDSEPLMPSKDPWYTAPPNFETKNPGDILRVRSAPGNLTKVVGNAVAAYNILYRTTDARNSASWAVTTLFLPPTVYKSPSGKAALVTYDFAYNTANLDSSPSIGLYWRLAQDYPPLGLKSDTSLINEMLSNGWIVNAPDYWGPLASFGAGVQGGHATLDSMRALNKVAGVTDKFKLNHAMWSYSGGTIGVMPAAQMYATYASELNLVGSAVGGLVDNVAADFDIINESAIAATIPAVLLGITAQFPDARKYLVGRLVDSTKDEFMSVIDINAADASSLFAFKDIYAYFKGGKADLQDPMLTKLFETQANVAAKSVPTKSLYVYKAIGDEYVPISQTDATVKRFCDAGADVTYERNTVGEHVSEIENGKPDAIKYLWSVLNESKKPTGCTIVDVTQGTPLP